MNNEILDLLEEEVIRELNDLKTLIPGTEDYGNAVVDLCKLYELRLKEKSNENSHEEKQAQMALNKKELELKQAQINNQVNSSEKELEFKKEQFCDDRERFDKEIELKKAQINNQVNSSEKELEFKKEQFCDDRKRFDKEMELKQAQLDQEVAKNAECFHVDAKKLRYDNIREVAKLGVDIMGIALPLVFYGVWMCKGFKFEETGTYTSTTFKNLFSRFRATKN